MNRKRLNERRGYRYTHCERQIAESLFIKTNDALGSPHWNEPYDDALHS